MRFLPALTLAACLCAGCATGSPAAATDCAAKYWPGTVEYATCYGNIDRQQSEMVDSMEWDEEADALGPIGGGGMVAPP